MKMTLKQVSSRYALLSKLGEMTLPARLGYAIGRNAEELSKEASRMERERVHMCTRYADKDSDGNPLMVDSVVHGERVQEYSMGTDARREFESEYAELLDTDVDVPITTVTPDIFERCDADSRYSALTVAQIAGLSFMLEGDADAAKAL